MEKISLNKMNSLFIVFTTIRRAANSQGICKSLNLHRDLKKVVDII